MVTVLHKICFELLHLIIQKSRNELCRPFFQISQAFFLSLLWSVPGKKGPKKVGILMPSFLFKFSGEMKCLTWFIIMSANKFCFSNLYFISSRKEFIPDKFSPSACVPTCLFSTVLVLLMKEEILCSCLLLSHNALTNTYFQFFCNCVFIHIILSKTDIYNIFMYNPFSLSFNFLILSINLKSPANCGF